MVPTGFHIFYVVFTNPFRASGDGEFILDESQ